MMYFNIHTSIRPYKGINKNTIINIWSPCLNFAIPGVTCSLVHRIRCAPGKTKGVTGWHPENFRKLSSHIESESTISGFTAFKWKEDCLRV